MKCDNIKKGVKNSFTDGFEGVDEQTFKSFKDAWNGLIGSLSNQDQYNVGKLVGNLGNNLECFASEFNKKKTKKGNLLLVKGLQLKVPNASAYNSGIRSMH